MSEPRKEPPYMDHISQVKTDRWYLTNCIWHPSFGGFDIGQPETGVKPVRDGVVVHGPGTFRLIQHGWTEFETANKIILKALDKGWDECRISGFIQWFAERRHRARFA